MIDADGERRTGRAAAAAFAVLLLATFGAFLIASRLKAEPAVLKDLQRTAFFSPNGDGRRDVERITFSAELDDPSAAVDVVDADGVRVRRIASDRRIRRGKPVRVRWDGHEDDGSRAPDGAYRLRVTLGADGRSIIAPKPFTVDTEPPDPAATIRKRDVIVRPGQPVRFYTTGAGTTSRADYVVVRTDGAKQHAVDRFTGRRGDDTDVWDGRLDSGKPAPVGTYLLAVRSRDKAGNEGAGPPIPAQRGTIRGHPGFTIRELAVQPPVRAVAAGTIAGFRVDARHRTYSWSLRRLGSRRTVAASRRPKRSTTLLVRAPKLGSGVYLLEVRSHGSSTRVPFAVQGRGHRRLTVVLPMLTWLGRDPVQDARAPDGLPDLLSAGQPVPYPRLFAWRGGLPPHFADDVAPLLVWLDRQHLRYDVTTDLALALSPDPAPGAKVGLLFAGAPEYVSADLAKRLRGFVAAGGRVALAGAPALRAGVTVADRQLTRPTALADVDAFGARLAKPRSLGDGAPLAVLQEARNAGLLQGFSGTLAGFSTVEELESSGLGRVVAGVGQPLSEAEAAKAEQDNVTPREVRPSFSSVSQGKGLVIRIGIDGWVQRLAQGDAAVGQLTRNAVDLLRGVRPKARTAAG